MKREDIFEAASKHYTDMCTCKDSWDEEMYKDGFVDGAKWRIDSVWHKSLKDAKPEKQVLVKFTNKLITTFDDVRYLKGIEDMVEEFAYVEDLIPNTEE